MKDLRSLVWLLVVWLLVTAVPAGAQDVGESRVGTAQARVALVIGNGAYRNAPRLPNPPNDARAMADLLRGLGFTVIEGIDLDRGAMEELLRRFETEARQADVALTFYAGHGIQVDGTNYLLPIDATLVQRADLRRLISADWLVEDAALAKRLAIVILDACRDNPLANNLRSNERSLGVGRGLALPQVQPPNTLIAYATKENATAADGEGRNSPFTTALLEHLATPGLEVGLAFRRVRDTVFKTTNGVQQPFTYGSLGAEEFYFAPGTTAPAQAPIVEAANRQEPVADGASRASLVEALPRGAAGAPFRDCADCPELVPLSIGLVVMGSPREEAGHEVDEIMRPAEITRPFAIGRHELTMAEWDACVTAGGCPWRPDDRGLGRDRMPAFDLSADDARAYLAWLAERTGKPYRLPSEAEWEHAARALTRSAYFWGPDMDARHAACEGCAGSPGPRRPAPVGTLPPNPFGLFDTAGSLWEWTSTCWTPAEAGRACVDLVLKGGSFLSRPQALRSASRERGFPDQRLVSRGFRVARDLLPDEAPLVALPPAPPAAGGSG